MLRALLEASFWKLAGFVTTHRRVQGIDFIFVNTRGDRFVQELSPVLEQALDRIAAAGPEYHTLVRDNLRFVAAANIREDYVSVRARGYVSAFSNSEVISPHYLALNLIWASELIRFRRAELSVGHAPDKAAARQVARDAQLRFVRAFPDSEDWVEFVERHPLE